LPAKLLYELHAGELPCACGAPAQTIVALAEEGFMPLCPTGLRALTGRPAPASAPPHRQGALQAAEILQAARSQQAAGVTVKPGFFATIVGASRQPASALSRDERAVLLQTALRDVAAVRDAARARAAPPPTPPTPPTPPGAKK